jgi:hypothetical protein
MAHYRRHMRSPLLLLLCLILLPPVCLAQSRADDAALTDADEQPQAGEAPRSAMGRVMGIMIEALRQEAMRGTPAGTDVTTRNGGPDNGETLDIEVGGAFRLQPPERTSTGPGCDVQPCDRDSVPNLRIASQK